MPYIINYDIAGIAVFIIVLFLYSIKSRIPSWRTHIYFISLIDAFLAVVFDLISCFTDVLPNDYLLLKYTVTILHLLTGNLVVIFYYLVLYSVLHEQKEFNNIQKTVLVCSIAIISILIITTPLTHFVVFFDDNNNYVYGMGLKFLYLINFFYVILGLYQVFAYGKNLSFPKKCIIVIYIIVGIVFPLYQFFHPNTLVIGFGCSLIAIYTNQVLLNLVEYTNSNTDTYNEKALTEIMQQNSYNNKNTSFVVLAILSWTRIFDQFGFQKGFIIISQYIHKIKDTCRVKYIFEISDGCFLIICKNQQEKKKFLGRFKFFNNENDYVKDSISSLNDIPLLLQTKVFILDNSVLLEETKVKFSQDEIMNFINYAITKNKNEKKSEYVINENDLINFYDLIKLRKEVFSLIDDNSVQILFQPIYNFEQKKFTAAEIKPYIKDSNNKLVPIDFMQEEINKNVDVLNFNKMILLKICNFIKNNKLVETSISRIQFKLSSFQCFQEEFFHEIIKILDCYGIPHSYIIFEINEMIISRNKDSFSAMMQDFSDQGICFGLDEYGTGYENTANILQFPYTEIKLDKDILNSIEGNKIVKENTFSISQLINMAKENKLPISVRGVDSASESRIFENFECNFIQGSFYSNPLEESDFISLVNK